MGEIWPNDMRDGKADLPDEIVKIVDCPFCTAKNGMTLENGDDWHCFVCGTKVTAVHLQLPKKEDLNAT